MVVKAACSALLLLMPENVRVSVEEAFEVLITAIVTVSEHCQMCCRFSINALEFKSDNLGKSSSAIGLLHALSMANHRLLTYELVSVLQLCT